MTLQHYNLRILSDIFCNISCKYRAKFKEYFNKQHKKDLVTTACEFCPLSYTHQRSKGHLQPPAVLSTPCTHRQPLAHISTPCNYLSNHHPHPSPPTPCPRRKGVLDLALQRQMQMSVSGAYINSASPVNSRRHKRGRRRRRDRMREDSGGGSGDGDVTARKEMVIEDLTETCRKCKAQKPSTLARNSELSQQYHTLYNQSSSLSSSQLLSSSAYDTTFRRKGCSELPSSRPQSMCNASTIRGHANVKHSVNRYAKGSIRHVSKVSRLLVAVLAIASMSSLVSASEYPDRECCDSAPPPKYHTVTPHPASRLTTPRTGFKG